MKHNLKIQPELFSEVWEGRKKFEFCINDKNYQVGDDLLLLEFDPQTSTYTGRWIEVTITYKLEDEQWGLPQNFCILSIQEKILRGE